MHTEPTQPHKINIIHTNKCRKKLTKNKNVEFQIAFIQFWLHQKKNETNAEINMLEVFYRRLLPITCYDWANNRNINLSTKSIG